MLTLSDLLQQHCQHQSHALEERQVKALLALLPDWQRRSGKEMPQRPEAEAMPCDQRESIHIACCFRFANYAHTLAFVNAVAALAMEEDHHPTMVVDYNRCQVRFTTHSVNAGHGGLSMNDFICAAKANHLFAQGSFRHDPA